MDTTVITELAEYYQKEIGYKIPPQTPFVGSALMLPVQGFMQMVC